jgi:hypothetical protein
MTHIMTVWNGALPFIALVLLALIGRPLLSRSSWRFASAAREILLLVPVVLMYFLARGVSAAQPTEAIEHAKQLVSLEQHLGIFRERALQLVVLRMPALIELANWTYIFGHWPVIATTFVWLAVKHRDHISVYRNALSYSGAVGIIVFFLYPVAPPRLLEGYGFVDTVIEGSRAYRVLQPASLTDIYASMPSLHVGWNLIMGVALVRESRNTAARIFGAVMPAIMAMVVVVTANHYFVDVLAGVSLVLMSLIAAQWIQKRELRIRTSSSPRRALSRAQVFQAQPSGLENDS